jgi:peptidoglycan/LPS O-acetylase OafA/YrhL
MKLTYRPEIDGLRAIAVSVVILYHAQITILAHQLFKGGFIGVDIFFVISGYLITSIILKELFTTGYFSFKYFYERRVRRILPVLLFVMLVSLPFAWMYLIPSNFIDFSKSILYSLGFSSNFYFHYSGQQYGAESGLLKPFLHTWSLSVEEQYYILFPIVLLITFKYFRNYLIYILILGFVISLGLADWGSKNHPSFNFYVLPTRGWELLAGSILAYFEVSFGHRSKNRILNLILPSVGLILIGHSILFFNDEMFHPSFYTLSPIIGVCLIIWFSNKNELITKILSTKLFVGIGLISYSLYLWHYPIFAFARIKDSTSQEYDKFEWIVLTIILSLISYIFIERPFRDKKYKFNFIIKYLLVIILFIAIFNLISLSNGGFPKRNGIPSVLINVEKNLDYRKIYQNEIKCHQRKGNKGFCIFNELPENIGDIILLGDSQTDAILSNLIKKVSKTKFRIIHMSYSGNLYLPNFLKFNKKTNNILTDETWHEYRTNFLKNKTHKNTYVIIFGRYDYYFDKNLEIIDGKIKKTIGKTEIKISSKDNKDLDLDERNKLLKDKFKKTIEILSEDKKIILLYPSPVSPVSITNRILQNKNQILKDFNFFKTDFINYSVDIHREYFFEEIKFLNNINSKNIFKIDLEKAFCPENQCFFYDNKNVYIFDENHPSYEGSKKINDLIMKEIEKIELKSN